ncbi:MAG: phosphoribosyltransferase, partial [Proteobacteria bacterium]
MCKACEDDIKPHLGKRKLKNDFYVYSFFGYNEIAPLLHTKHHHCGAYIYKILAKKAFGRFLDELDLPFLNIIPIDDRTKGAYSHTAVLANAIKSKKIKPHYGSLRARNRVSYSGKSLRYRKANPRDF